MNPALNDPRLTAYALGELEEADSAAFEAAFDLDDDEVKEEIEEIAALATLLQSELSGEEAPTLTEAQRASVMDARLAEEEEEAASNVIPLHDPDAKTSRVATTASAGHGEPEAPVKRSWALPGIFAAAAALTLTAGLVSTTSLFMTGEDAVGPSQATSKNSVEKPQNREGTEMPLKTPAVYNAMPEPSDGQPVELAAASTPSTPIAGTGVADVSASDSLDEKNSGSATIVNTGGQKIVVNKPGYTAQLIPIEKSRSAPINGWAGKKANGPTLNEAGDSGVGVDAPAFKSGLKGEGRFGENRGRRARGGEVTGERYEAVVENPFKSVSSEPLSTFSIDVDTASYSNMRRFLKRNTLPPASSVRIEEMVNYFDYSYAPPTRPEQPFSVNLELADSPFSSNNKLVRVGLKGREIHTDQRPVSNLVFLLDVSGSMGSPNKLPLLKKSLSMLVERLGEKDRVAIVVYAGASGLVLPSTSAKNKRAIMNAMNRLQSGGSTNGASGIELAYRVAVSNFVEGGTNRVILCTDGDFNVGATSNVALQGLIERKARSGVFLSVLGFGMGNLNDQTLETLADKGNGNYAYIDTEAEAKKVLVDQLSGTLVTIAKDVKIQVEFNPARVSAYRLIGYSNRMLAAKDFADDTKDAGEIGAGHTVTALYEVVPVGAATGGEVLKYQKTPTPGGSSELLTVKLRHKEPDGETSKLWQFPLEDSGGSLTAATPDFRFAAAVAMFGQLLSGSAHSGGASWDRVLELAESGARGHDVHGYRAEFIALVQTARSLSGSPR